MTNKAYFLALNRIPRLGPRTLFQLLEKISKLSELFELSLASLKELGLTEAQALMIRNFNTSSIEEDLSFELKENHHILTLEDPRYPPLLKEIYDPPMVLYAIGDLKSLTQPCLSLIGSRHPSASGSETAWSFAKILATAPITVVSGLAYGIDAKAHEGCLAGNGKTIAVMGTGIDVIYPRSHLSLANKIKDSGLLLSEFPLKSPPMAGHFPRRNRIISGLSLATLVIEAAIKSGSLITARLALEQNRDVFAIPGSIYNLQAKGCHYLIQQGAKLVTSVTDILDELNFCDTKDFSQEGKPLAISDLKLVRCIDFEMTPIDKIVDRSGLSVQEVTCELASLELQGFIKALPGGYARCVDQPGLYIP